MQITKPIRITVTIITLILAFLLYYYLFFYLSDEADSDMVRTGITLYLTAILVFLALAILSWFRVPLYQNITKTGLVVMFIIFLYFQFCSLDRMATYMQPSPYFYTSALAAKKTSYSLNRILQQEYIKGKDLYCTDASIYYGAGVRSQHTLEGDGLITETQKNWFLLRNGVIAHERRYTDPYIDSKEVEKVPSHYYYLDIPIDQFDTVIILEDAQENRYFMPDSIYRELLKK